MTIKILKIATMHITATMTITNVTVDSSKYHDNVDNDHNNNLTSFVVVIIVIVDNDHNNNTGVCKINGVVIVVNCCYSIGFSTKNNNKNTVYFANTGNNNKQ